MSALRIKGLVQPKFSTAVFLLFSTLFILVPLNAAQLKTAALPAAETAHENITSARQSGQEYFVDGINGSDSNPGTIDQPLLTIDRAAKIAGPGDVVQIRGGTYRETVNLEKSGEEGKPITFQAYQDEEVIISGAVHVSGWSDPDGDGIYQATVPEAINLPPENYQVFVNGRMAPQAREGDLVDPFNPFSQQWLPTQVVKPTASISLMTKGGKWLQAFQRGGDRIYATGATASDWEEFYLIDINGGALKAGDLVAFMTDDHKHYITPEGGGRTNPTGDYLVATRTKDDFWERFTIGKPGGGKGEIKPGDWITLKAYKGGYLTSYYKNSTLDNKCGGAMVYADVKEENLGACEEFLLVYKDIKSISIKSANNLFLTAPTSMNRRLTAKQEPNELGRPSERGIFDLIDLNGGALESGDKIGLRLGDGRYLAAESGGRVGQGDYLGGVSKEFGENEKFTIEKTAITPPGNTVIANGDTFSLKTTAGAYISIDVNNDGNCENDKVIANRPTVGKCETFTIYTDPQPLAIFDQTAAGISNIENIWAGSYLWGTFDPLRSFFINVHGIPELGEQFGEWWANTAKISASKPGKLILSQVNNNWFTNGWTHGHAAIISNKVQLINTDIKWIDTDYEWVFDPNSSGPGGTLYFKPPVGSNPNDLRIEIRTRTWVVDGGVNVNLQSANGKYLRENSADLRRVKADGDTPGPDETFSLVDPNGGALVTNDRIGLISKDGYYLTAENGGRRNQDDYLAARAEVFDEWETFLINIPGGDKDTNETITPGYQITLLAAEANYVSADQTSGQCGGGFVHVNVQKASNCETFTITTHEISYIVLRNLNFFAGQIKLVGDYNLLENVAVDYGTHFNYRESMAPDDKSDHESGNNGVYLRGDVNTLRNCKIAYSAGNAVTIVGDYNLVENCLIHDFGTMGPNSSGVFFDGHLEKLTHSTMFNSGRDVLNLSRCQTCKITYNHLYNSTLLTDDSGVIYSWSKDLDRTEIAYNWIQAVVGKDPTVITDTLRLPTAIQIGIYLDNSSRNAIVHHNVISDLSDKPGVGPNTPHEGHLICNNTIINNYFANQKNKTVPDAIGFDAACSCSNTEEAHDYFASVNECNAEKSNTDCIHGDWEYWINPENPLANKENNPRRLKVYNISPYYISYSEAADDLINPINVQTDETGWRIQGYPDFRPKDSAKELVDKGTNCDQLIFEKVHEYPEVIGKAPDLGAYENGGTNWIPGYKEAAYGVHDSYVMAKNQPYFVPAPGVLANDPPASGAKRVYYIVKNLHQVLGLFELHLFHDYWFTDDLTERAAHGSQPAPNPVSTSVTSLTAGGEPRVYYLGPANHIHELAWLEAPQRWTWRDINSFTDAPAAAPDSQLQSITINGVPHVYYLSTDGHIHEMIWTGKDWSVWETDDWQHSDLTAVTQGSPAISSGSFAVTKTSNDDPRIYYFAQDGNGRHVHELAYRKLTGKWEHTDFNTLIPDAAQPASGSPMAVTTAELRPRVYYLAEIKGETHLAEFYWYGNIWRYSDLTAAVDEVTHSTTARPEVNSALVATTVDSLGDPRIYFASGSTGAYHIFEIGWYSGSWHYRDITQGARAGSPALYSPLAVMTEGLLPRVYYVATNITVHELIWSAPDDWRDYDISTGPVNPDALVNSDLSAIKSGGGPLYARLTRSTEHGTLRLNPDGSFFYLPEEGYTGPDSFIYVVEDGLAESESTIVRISVAAPPQTPSTSSIKGVVTRESDNAPVSLAIVSAYRYYGTSWEWVAQAVTAADGSYEVGNLLPGLYRLRFQDSVGIYNIEYYPDKPDIESAVDIWVDTDSPTTGIDAALAYRSELFSEAPYLSAGENFNCALMTSGLGSCWGDDTFGQAKARPGVFEEIAAGANHACGLTPQGQAVCWGDNSQDQAADQDGPFVHLSAAQDRTCGLNADGSVTCWGAEGRRLSSLRENESYAQFTAGGSHICALTAEGLITCWGQNNYGQLNHPDGLFNQISAGADHTCALSIEGQVQCWGRNNYSQAESPLGTYTQVAAGEFHSCGLKLDGSIHCWGRGDQGQTGDKTGPFSYVNAGGFHSCGLLENGSAECWGRNDHGQAESQAGPFGPPQPRILFPLIMDNAGSIKDAAGRPGKRP